MDVADLRADRFTKPFEEPPVEADPGARRGGIPDVHSPSGSEHRTRAGASGLVVIGREGERGRAVVMAASGNADGVS
jgi:hypothetical protein